MDDLKQDVVISYLLFFKVDAFNFVTLLLEYCSGEETSSSHLVFVAQVDKSLQHD